MSVEGKPRRIFFKKETNQSTYDAALERIEELYDRFDKVVVSFSGGKDSTVCLNLCLKVATALRRLPLDVYFWDEEAIQPETVEYVERVRRRDDVRLKWLCVPIKHRNACSRTQPYWYPWHPDDEKIWCRPLPKKVLRTIPRFEHGDSIPDIAHHVYGPEFGTIADVRGLRADESIRRYRAVCMRMEDNWIGAPRSKYSYPVSPIYDWTAVDVWTAPKMFKWDYNRAYDIMTLAGLPINQQRVCPPYGEEPLGNLWMYAECWPGLWHKMLKRVPGASTAGRYAASELYGYGKFQCPPGLTWKEYTYRLLKLYPKDIRGQMQESLEKIIYKHEGLTRGKAITEENPDLISGLSWKLLANIMHRGDLKNRRAEQLINKASAMRETLGLTLEDVLKHETESDTRI